MSVASSDLVGITMAVVVFGYLGAGLLVVGYISLRGPKWLHPPRNGLLWEKKDNTRNVLWEILAWGKMAGPIGFFVEIVLWPVWLVILWMHDKPDDS